MPQKRSRICRVGTGEHREGRQREMFNRDLILCVFVLSLLLGKNQKEGELFVACSQWAPEGARFFRVTVRLGDSLSLCIVEPRLGCVPRGKTE